jgi:hypothetical protein
VVRGPIAAGVLLLCAASAASGPDASPAPVSWNSWRSLHLRARKMLFFTGSVRLHLREGAGRRVLTTDTHARFMGAELTRTRTETIIDAATGRTLEFRSLSPKRGRHYLFDESGYTVRKLSPVRGADTPLEAWQVKSEQRFSYPESEREGRALDVRDYYGMILGLRELGLRRPGDEARFHVATSKGVRAYRLRVSEVREHTRAFHELGGGPKRREAVRELRLRVIPDGPGSADEGFLNMEGETELWVEAGSGTLLEITGKIPKVPGRVEVELHAIG